MASTAIASLSASTRTERYLEAERRLWQHYGLEPNERFLDLDAPATRLRVLEIGSGEPILYVHGTVGPGGWPSLISELPGYRSIVLERPGWGLSSAIDFSRHEYKTLVANVLRGALDALEIERAHVVGGSIGNVWALRLAAQQPSRVERIVLMGGGPIVAEAGVPGIIRLLASDAPRVRHSRPHGVGRDLEPRRGRAPSRRTVFRGRRRPYAVVRRLDSGCRGAPRLPSRMKVESNRNGRSGSNRAANVHRSPQPCGLAAIASRDTA
jgi:pimeloyl-ACP methyl ester carboxylesterase